MLRSKSFFFCSSGLSTFGAFGVFGVLVLLLFGCLALQTATSKPEAAPEVDTFVVMASLMACLMCLVVTNVCMAMHTTSNRALVRPALIDPIEDFVESLSGILRILSVGLFQLGLSMDWIQMKKPLIHNARVFHERVIGPDMPTSLVLSHSGVILLFQLIQWQLHISSSVLFHVLPQIVWKPHSASGMLGTQWFFLCFRNHLKQHHAILNFPFWASVLGFRFGNLFLGGKLPRNHREIWDHARPFKRMQPVFKF